MNWHVGILFPFCIPNGFNILTIGTAVCRRIAPAQKVLDFGCGVGILTIFFALQHPDVEFVGIDRSSRSVEMACLEAEKRQIRNVRFEISHVPPKQISGNYDLNSFDECVVSGGTGAGAS